MHWAGDDVPSSHVAVEELGLAERCDIAEQGWREVVSDGKAWQLGHRAETLTGACDATFLGIRDAAGRVVSRLDLYAADGITQLEELITDPAHRQRGMGRALIGEGVRLAGNDGVFLIAEDGSAPAAMYRRLGFRDVGGKASLARP